MVIKCCLSYITSAPNSYSHCAPSLLPMHDAGLLCVVACVWRLGSMCCRGGGPSDMGGGGDGAGVITRQLSMRRNALNVSTSRSGHMAGEEKEEERKGHSALDEGAVCGRGGASGGGERPGVWDRSRSGSAASGHGGGVRGGDGSVVVVLSEDGEMSPVEAHPSREGAVVRGSEVRGSEVRGGEVRGGEVGGGEVGGGEGATSVGGGAIRGGQPPAAPSSAVGEQGGAAYPVIPAASAALGGPCPAGLHAVEAGAGSSAGAGRGPRQPPLPALSAPQVCLAGGPGSARPAEAPTALPAHSLSLPGHGGGAGEGVPAGLGPGGVLPRAASHDSHTTNSALTSTPSLRARLDRMRANLMAVARQVVVVESLQAAAAAASLTPNLTTFVDRGKQGGREGAGRGSTGQAGSAPSLVPRSLTPSSSGSAPVPHLPWAAHWALPGAAPAAAAPAAAAPAAAVATGGTSVDGAPAAAGAGVGASVRGAGAQQPSTPPKQPAA